MSFEYTLFTNNQLITRIESTQSFRKMKKEITDIHMNDTIPAKIKIIKRKNILRIIVFDSIISRELSFNRLSRIQKITDVNVDTLVVLIRDKIDLS